MSSTAPAIGAPPGPSSLPLIGTRLPNFDFRVDEWLFSSAVRTTVSAAGEPLGCPRSPRTVFQPVERDGRVGSPGRSTGSALLGVVPERQATRAAVGTEQLVALPPELDAVTQNCSACPMSADVGL